MRNKIANVLNKPFRSNYLKTQLEKQEKYKNKYLQELQEYEQQKVFKDQTLNASSVHEYSQAEDINQDSTEEDQVLSQRQLDNHPIEPCDGDVNEICDTIINETPDVPEEIMATAKRDEHHLTSYDTVNCIQPNRDSLEDNDGTVIFTGQEDSPYDPSPIQEERSHCEENIEPFQQQEELSSERDDLVNHDLPQSNNEEAACREIYEILQGAIEIDTQRSAPRHNIDTDQKIEGNPRIHILSAKNSTLKSDQKENKLYKQKCKENKDQSIFEILYSKMQDYCNSVQKYKKFKDNFYDLFNEVCQNLKKANSEINKQQDADKKADNGIMSIDKLASRFQLFLNTKDNKQINSIHQLNTLIHLIKELNNKDFNSIKRAIITHIYRIIDKQVRLNSQTGNSVGASAISNAVSASTQSLISLKRSEVQHRQQDESQEIWDVEPQLLYIDVPSLIEIHQSEIISEREYSISNLQLQIQLNNRTDQRNSNLTQLNANMSTKSTKNNQHSNEIKINIEKILFALSVLQYQDQQKLKKKIKPINHQKPQTIVDEQDRYSLLLYLLSNCCTYETNDKTIKMPLCQQDIDIISNKEHDPVFTQYVDFKSVFDNLKIAKKNIATSQNFKSNSQKQQTAQVAVKQEYDIIQNVTPSLNLEQEEIVDINYREIPDRVIKGGTPVNISSVFYQNMAYEDSAANICDDSGNVNELQPDILFTQHVIKSPSSNQKIPVISSNNINWSENVQHGLKYDNKQQLRGQQDQQAPSTQIMQTTQQDNNVASVSQFTEAVPQIVECQLINTQISQPNLDEYNQQSTPTYKESHSQPQTQKNQIPEWQHGHNEQNLIFRTPQTYSNRLNDILANHQQQLDKIQFVYQRPKTDKRQKTVKQIIAREFGYEKRSQEVTNPLRMQPLRDARPGKYAEINPNSALQNIRTKRKTIQVNSIMGQQSTKKHSYGQSIQKFINQYDVNTVQQKRNSYHQSNQVRMKDSNNQAVQKQRSKQNLSRGLRVSQANSSIPQQLTSKNSSVLIKGNTDIQNNELSFAQKTNLRVKSYLQSLNENQPQSNQVQSQNFFTDNQPSLVSSSQNVEQQQLQPMVSSNRNSHYQQSAVSNRKMLQSNNDNLNKYHPVLQMQRQQLSQLHQINQQIN